MRKRPPETLLEWIENYEPDCEEATLKLCRMILREEGSKDDLQLLAEYIEGWYEDDDPISMGWVGSDGLP